MKDKKEQTMVWLRPSTKKIALKLCKKHNLSRSELVEKLIIQANAKTS